MSEAIRVVCRFRRDAEGKEIDDWKFDHDIKQISLGEKKYNFDEIMDMNCDQVEMYEKVALKTIENFCNGFHGTIFAYGNSGSGKTFCIVGPDEIVEWLARDFSSVPENIQLLYGIIPRLTISVFSAINDAVNSGGTAELKASYIEIYNETITCLLNQKENLKLKEVPKVGFCIVGNEEVPCKRPEDIFQILYTGTNNKTTGGTMQNSRSSRSHTLLTLELKVKSVEGSERLSKLTIVDLAGSEKLKNTGANTPERMKEAQKINQSLTSLGMCITALANGDSFVPFRTSKLTLLLKEPLTGNSKTTLLCAARRDKQLVEDNLNSLSFAVRAKNIKVTVKKNVTLSDKEYQYLIDALKGEVLILRKQVKDGGRDFHKITDPKLLSILTNEESAKEGGEAEGDPQSTTTQGEVQSSTTSTGNAPKKQRPRTSLLDLTEEEIIIKYCELKAKYDNLLDNAGHKIMDLTNRASLKQSSLDPEMLKKMNEQREELEKKLDDLTEEKNKEIDQLKDSNEKLTKEKKNLEEELEVAKGDADGLQSMLDLNTADIENLQEQVSKLEAANDLLTKNSGDFESTLKQKTEAIEKLNSTVQEIEVEKINLSRKLDEQRSNYEKEIAALNEQLRLSQERESKLSKENEEMKEEQAKSSNESKAKDTKILELENQIMTIQNDLEKVNVQVGYKDQTIKSLQDEIDRFKSMENEKISDKALFAEKDKLYNENKKVLEERIAKLHEQNEKASSQIIELTNKSNEEKMQFNEAVEELNKANKSLSDEISSYKGEIEKLKVQFKNDLEKKDKEISEKIKKIEDIENNSIKYLEKEKELNNEMLSLEEKFREKSVQVEKLTIDLNSRAKENEKYQSEISAEQVKSKKLKDDLDAAKADFEKYKKSGEAEKEVTEKMEKKMNELRREQDVLRNTNRKLTQEIQDLKSALEETEKKLERSGGAITEKVNISGFSKFGVHMLKKTGNKYLKEAKLENKKNMMISESIMQDKIDELKKLRQNIDQLSPKTVSSHGSDLADMPEVDYNDMESYKKAQEILMKKAKERELKKQKIEEEKRKNQMLEGM